MFDLIVKTPFGGHEVGTRLTDPALVAEIVAGERETSVIKVAPLPPAAPEVADETAAVVVPVVETAPETSPAKPVRGAKAATA